MMRQRLPEVLYLFPIIMRAPVPHQEFFLVLQKVQDFSRKSSHQVLLLQSIKQVDGNDHIFYGPAQWGGPLKSSRVSLIHLPGRMPLGFSRYASAPERNRPSGRTSPYRPALPEKDFHPDWRVLSGLFSGSSHQNC